MINIKEDHLYDVGIILVNYNSSSYTIQCVNSIYANTDPEIDFKIIIVDNGSLYEEFIKLSELKLYDKVEIIRSRYNLGFSAGNMFGVQFVRANYLFFLNNDCELLNDCVSILLNFCKNNKKIGMCSPQMYSENDIRIGSFDYLPRLSTRLLGLGVLRLFQGDSYMPRKNNYSVPIKVEVLSGSQLFVSTDFFYKSGGFDINLFLYCEEEDLAFKAKKYGYLCYLVPDAKNKHYSGKSTIRDYYILREFYISYFYVLSKYYSAFSVIIFRMYTFFRLIKKSFKDIASLKLAFFVIFGSPLRFSLRHRQKVLDK